MKSVRDALQGIGFLPIVGISVGFTGTQVGMTITQIVKIRDVLQHLLPQNAIIAAHHGDCVGADDQFDERCVALSLRRVIHPPLVGDKRAYCHVRRPGDVDVLPEQEYMVRNASIVAAADVMIAGPSGPEEARSGTWATVRRARAARRPLIVVMPDGSICGEP